MRRRTKLVTALLVVLAASALLLWNTTAQTAPAALGVTEAKREAAALSGREVAVRGTVVEGTIEERGNLVERFVIEDAFERLRVEFNQTPPDNFGVKEVVVKGLVETDEAGTPVLRAHSLQVGCSSKY